MFPPRISLKLRHQAITAILFAFLGLMLALSIQMVLGEKAIGTESVATQLIASSASTASAADLSARGRALYERGDFAGAIDFWQKAVDIYRRQGNEPEKINNQINLAQAEQALGLYPRAYKTLIPIYFDQPIYLDKQDCTVFPQEDECRTMFIDTLKQQANSPAKIAGLRNLGNILRGLGELDLSEEVLSLSLEKSAQNKAAILLDLGNTRRALSNKEQDLYNRSQERENLKQAGKKAKAALENYLEVVNSSNFTTSASSITYLQAKLNKLSFLVEINEWFSQIQKQFKAEKKLEDNPALGAIREQLLDEITQQRTELQIVDDQLTNLRTELSQLQSQIEKLPLSQTTLYMRLNFAQSLRRFKDQQVEPFLKATIEQAKTQKNPQVESYARGYLGKYYKDNRQPELAEKETQQALIVAQSLPDPYILYRWQWQLGQIYKSQGNLKEARLTYQGAFDTLESLRRELATSNPDAQVSFLEDIETIYRQYVDLILQENNPNPTDLELEEARKVIASLQLVELENFLRQACPENNLKQIDEILDTDPRASKTAFLYPIVINDDNKENVRVEVILKLPNSSTGLQHYRSERINRLNFEKIIRDVQIALQEEYTFDEVKEKGHEVYNWLLKGAEKYLTDIDTLVFAIDTTLRNIPLAALVDDNQKYIVQKYAIALAPRLEIQDFQTLQDKTNILVAGLSKARLLGEQSEAKKRFLNLPHVKKELEAIKALEKGNSRVSVTELCDEDKLSDLNCREFTIANFNQEFTTSPFQIVHLATHGEFSSSPEKTFILALDHKNELPASDLDNKKDTPASDLDNKKDTLASDDSSNTAKMINVNELYKLFQTRNQEQANTIELLILSACETATGDKRATLGISGVGVRAGAQSAIASLWTLDDSASADFTKELYEQLISRNQKITKAKALQQAQLKFIPPDDDKSEYRQYQHPRYWAPYILVGNWL